jgi:hypothetical protein
LPPPFVCVFFGYQNFFEPHFFLAVRLLAYMKNCQRILPKKPLLTKSILSRFIPFPLKKIIWPRAFHFPVYMSPTRSGVALKAEMNKTILHFLSNEAGIADWKVPDPFSVQRPVMMKTAEGRYTIHEAALQNYSAIANAYRQVFINAQFPSGAGCSG